MAVVPQALHRYGAGAEGIQVEVMADLAQRFAFLDQQGLVAALKQVSAFAAQLVEPVGEGGLQPLHPRHQVALRCLQRQMVVIAHDDKRMEHPA